MWWQSWTNTNISILHGKRKERRKKQLLLNIFDLMSREINQQLFLIRFTVMASDNRNHIVRNLPNEQQQYIFKYEMRKKIWRMLQRNNISVSPSYSVCHQPEGITLLHFPFFLSFVVCLLSHITKQNRSNHKIW